MALDVTELTLLEHTKTSIIKSLRHAFSLNTEYRYIEDPRQIGPDFANEDLGIVITDVYTYDVKFLPAITITAGSGSDFPISFSQNRYYIRSNPTTGEQWYEYASAWDMTVGVRVSAEDPMTREQVVDLTCMTLMHWQRQKLYEHEGVFIKKVDFGGESEEPYANDYIFSQDLSVPVYVEWNHKIDIGPKLLGFGLEMGLFDNGDILNTVMLQQRVVPMSSSGGRASSGSNKLPPQVSNGTRQWQELGRGRRSPVGFDQRVQ